MDPSKFDDLTKALAIAALVAYWLVRPWSEYFRASPQLLVAIAPVPTSATRSLGPILLWRCNVSAMLPIIKVCATNVARYPNVRKQGESQWEEPVPVRMGMSVTAAAAAAFKVCASAASRPEP